MKFISIQILRGGAAWMVVFHHFFQIFFNHNTSNSIVNFLSYHFSIGVDIFFVISGFIMAYVVSTNTNLTFLSFIKNRLIRIVPNYWFYTFSFLFVGLFIKELYVNNETVETILMSLFFISHPNPTLSLGYTPTLPVGWTLNFEMFFYFLVGLSLLFNFNNSRRLFFICVILIMFVTIYKIFKIDFYNQILAQVRLLEFVSGISLFLLREKYYKLFHSNFLIIFGCLMLYSVFTIDKLSILIYVVISSFIVYMFLLFENMFSRNKNNFINILVFQGKISYSLYLSHSMVLLVLFNIFYEFVYSYTLLIISMIIIYFISVTSYKYIEVKFANYIKGKI